eukprot:TRINITY_DN55761_c0_g1_i1.p1 TRINITY_DN55761_c0_g1~~TRINITY_DN55761_c0_g1_i1.p1  ORF type:complete len:172 (+),score=14.06 TRINITY_DN55761_c0_g1_i1:61-576(+)
MQMLDRAKKMVAAALASIVVATSAIPAQSMPISVNPAGADARIERVDGRNRNGDRGGRNWDRRPNSDHRHQAHNRDRHDRYPPGYRPPRPGPDYGWDNNDNAWVPLAVLGAGALIIGGAIAAGNNNRPQQTNGLNPKHYAWCDNRYRSYRSYDNTFQPYNGPRKQCLSPYY